MIKEYDYIGDFKNSFFKVRLNNKYGIVDETGKEVIECKYDGIWNFKNGFFEVALNGKEFWVNKDGIKIKIIELL